MYYVITDNAIHTSKTLKALNKKLDAKFFEEDFQRFGADRINNCTNEDLEFKRDLGQLDRVAVSKLYKNDSSRMLVIINMIITILIFLNMVQANSGIQVILSTLKKIGG